MLPQDVDEALKRLPQEVVDARNQRLKRAIDINMKVRGREREREGEGEWEGGNKTSASAACCSGGREGELRLPRHLAAPAVRPDKLPLRGCLLVPAPPCAPRIQSVRARCLPCLPLSPGPPLQHSELPKELQQLQTPFELYMKDTLDVSGSCRRLDVSPVVLRALPSWLQAGLTSAAQPPWR